MLRFASEHNSYRLSDCVETLAHTKGVMITTSTFSEEARAYITRIPKTIILIDGKRLVQLMIEHGVGVKVRETYLIHIIDSEYYELEEKSPVLSP